MRLGKSLGLATGLVFATAVSASAVTYATTVESTTLGTVGASYAGSGRDDSSNALGAPDGAFYSPGVGGEIVVSFGTVFTGDGVVYEVTNGSPAGWPESVDIYVSNSAMGAWGTAVASVDNSAAASGATFTFAGAWQYMRLVDTSVAANSGGADADGFDIDAIGVQAVPVPASALLLGAALAGLGVARRKS